MNECLSCLRSSAGPGMAVIVPWLAAARRAPLAAGILFLVAPGLLWAAAQGSHARRKPIHTNTHHRKHLVRHEHPVNNRPQPATSTTRSHRSRRSRRHRQPAQLSPSPDRVQEIQTALARQGYLQGQPSGKWDSQTVEAMQRFQDKNGLAPTGKLDAPTLQKLGLGSDIAGLNAPRQTPAPVSHPAAGAPPSDAPAGNPPSSSPAPADTTPPGS